MSRDIPPGPPEGADILVHPAQPPLRLTLGLDRPGPPRCGEAGMIANPGDFMLAIATTPFVSRNRQAWRLQSRQPWSYRRLVAYSFLGLSEGETRCSRHTGPSQAMD